jgi:hypothetical protein
MEHEETSTADERESRRLRRELLNTDASILYESDDQEDRQGPVTRARKLDQESMEISSEQQDGEQAQSEQSPAMNPPPPPPPPPPMYSYPIGPMPEQKAGAGMKKISKPKPKYSNMIANKVVINIVKATSGTNPSGVPDELAGPGPNSSSGSGSTSANPRGADGLFGQSEKTNGAYKAVFATRQSLRTNPVMNEAGGVAQEKISVGTFANRGDNRSSICHFRSLMDRKQNMSFSFDPQTLLCSNCPARGSLSGASPGTRRTEPLI